jgi:hypothetical protein
MKTSSMNKILLIVRIITHWSLLVVTVLFVLSGLGITHYQIITPLTFGILDKALSFKVHDVLWLPFTILLVLHILLIILIKKKKT